MLDKEEDSEKNLEVTSTSQQYKLLRVDDDSDIVPCTAKTYVTVHTVMPLY